MAGRRSEMDRSARRDITPGRTSGVVESYNPKRSPFGGFIEDDKTGVAVFVHNSAVQQAGLGKLEPGERIAFTVADDGFGGYKAVDLSRP